MEPFFIWVEHTGYSRWVREAVTMWAFPFMLILHAIGMGLVAGMHIAISLRILGVAPGIPLKALRAYFPLIWFGFVINLYSGISLLMAYPTKALTNPLFYIKITLVAVGVWTLRWMQKNVFDGGAFPILAPRFAKLAIFCWVAAIFAGRWLAYTYTKLMSSTDI